ncbi:MAG: DUF5723 family protein, partial [Cyclobacteriaceae bacterium]
LTKPQGDSTVFNRALLSQDTDKKDMFTVNGGANLNFGVRLNKKSFFTLSASAYTENSMLVPKTVFNFLEQGNAAFLGQEYEINDLRALHTTYGELAVGYGREVSLLGRKLTAGVRLKYLRGITHLSTDKNATATITTNNDGTFDVGFQDALVQTAGLDIEDGYQAKNTGFAIDFGGEYELTDKLAVSATIRDLGFISWKDNSKELKINDGSNISWNGANLEDFGDAEETTDSLADQFSTDEKEATFKKALTTEMYFGARYKLHDNIYASATMANYFRAGRFQTSLGVGITAEFLKSFVFSGTVAKVPENGIDFGAALALRLAILQIHIGVDGLQSANIAEASYAQLNTGVSFMFGRPSLKERRTQKKAEKKGLKAEKVKKNKTEKVKNKKKEDLGETKEQKESRKRKMDKLDKDKKAFERKVK